MEDIKKAISEVPGSRWNAIIAAVNGNVPKEEAGLKSKAEEEIYDSIKAEADALEKRGGVRPVFEPVEIESDDESLDIYNEPV